MEPHFFQILDRIRYEAALNALTREGKSLALISPVQALAEHYKECLLERLQRDLPDCEIKPFFPDDADAIVQKFNQVLADLPMAEALHPDHSAKGLKIWVVHDAGALPSHEALLLLQLLEKFPGAQVRAMLVYGGTQISPEGLDAREKSLLRWIVERPSLEQIKDSLAQEKDPERTAQLRALIQRMSPAGSISKDKRADAASSPAAPPPAAAPATSEKPRSARYKLLLGSAMALALLIFSVLVAVWLNPKVVDEVQSIWSGTAAPKTATDKDKSSEEPAKAEKSAADAQADWLEHPLVRKFLALWMDKPKATEPATDPDSAKAPQSTASNSGDKSGDNSADRSPAADSASGPAPEKKDGPAASSASTASEPAPSTAAAAPATSSKNPSPLLTELPDGAAKGERWAKGLEPAAWVIQHSISPTYAQAVEVQKKFPDLSQAQVVPQFVGAEKQARFALVSGPYANQTLASEFIQSKRVPKDAWVRTAKAMQDRLALQQPKTTPKPKATP